MPTYHVHRLKDHLRQPFRFAPHVSGTANIKPRDYEPAGIVEAATPYAAFFTLKDSESPLEPGDVLEAQDSDALHSEALPIKALHPEAGHPEAGNMDTPREAPPETPAAVENSLRIYKYVGFEEARWVLPEAPSESTPATALSEASVSL